MKDFISYGLLWKYGYLFIQDEEELLKVAFITFIVYIVLYGIVRLFHKNRIAIIIAVTAFMTFGLMGFIAYFLVRYFFGFLPLIFAPSDGASEQSIDDIEKSLELDEMERIVNALEEMDTGSEPGVYKEIYARYLWDKSYSAADIRRETDHLRRLLSKYK